MLIRRYEAKDAAAVWDLHNRALREVDAHAGNGAWDDDLHHIERVYLQNGGEFLVGLLQQRIVAMGALRRTGYKEAEVARMRVDPQCQRRGFGQAILNQLEAAALARGYTVLHLETTARQTAARALYEKNGYRQSGQHKLGRFTVLRYRKCLAPLR